MSVDLEMKANIDFFIPRAIKSTSNSPTKMFDTSKDRSLPKCLEKTMVICKTLSLRLVLGCTNLGPSWVISKWKISNSHVQEWRSL